MYFWFDVYLATLINNTLTYQEKRRSHYWNIADHINVGGENFMATKEDVCCLHEQIH